MPARARESLAVVYAALRSGDSTTARRLCGNLLEQIPHCPEAHHAMGLSAAAAGDYAAAAEHITRARALDGSRTTWIWELAVIHAKLQQWAETICLLTPILSTLDDHGLALYLAASVEVGAAAEAIQAVEALHPAGLNDDAVLLCEYGRALHRAGAADAAERAFCRALQLSPTNARTRDGLSTVYADAGRVDAVVRLCEAFVDAQPASGNAHLRLAIAYAEAACLQEARRPRLNATRLGLDPADYSMALFLMLSDECETEATVCHAHRAAFDTNAVVSTPRSRRRTTRDTRVRVGYCSGEFDVPPAHHFIRSFLDRHDRSELALFFYDTNPRSRRSPSYCRSDDRWRHVARLSDDELQAVLDADELDVLVDLAGHFPNNRLGVFARGVVDVQAAFPNYPSTTGCPEIDYLFTDRWTSPNGSDDQYVERLHRLASGYLVYTPPEEAGAVGPLPAHCGRHVTLGMVQRPLKLTAMMWDLLAGVLRGAPGAQLLIHFGDPFLDDADSQICRFMKRKLQERDVDPGRVAFVGPRPLAAHFEILSRMDLALDTAPYGGQTTTAGCLWMGVPVVTLTGRTHVSRVSAGLIRRAGCSELVASDAATYVDIATALASDVDRLDAYRRSMRGRMIDAGLTDGGRLAREMEHAYRTWQRLG